MVISPSELVKATLTENFDLINVAPERADVLWIVYGQNAAFHNDTLSSVPERNPSGQHGLLTSSAIKRLQIDIDVMVVSSCLKRALDVSTSLIKNLWQPAVWNYIRWEQAINDLKSNRRVGTKKSN